MATLEYQDGWFQNDSEEDPNLEDFLNEDEDLDEEDFEDSDELNQDQEED